MSKGVIIQSAIVEDLIKIAKDAGLEAEDWTFLTECPM